MATTTTPRTPVPPTDTMGPSGSTVACSSEPDRGSTALTTSTETLITVSIHITATLVQIRSVEKSPSITSTETRRVMDAATQAEKAAARNNVKLKTNGFSSAKRCDLWPVGAGAVPEIATRRVRKRTLQIFHRKTKRPRLGDGNCIESFSKL